MFLLLGLSLAGCSFGGEPLPSSRTEAAPATPGETNAANVIVTDTPLPSPTVPPRQLVVCMGAEPDSLFIYAGQMLAKQHVLEAIYEGPIDQAGFDYQPVILEKLPSLADGDARIEPVSVKKGDWVVNDLGELVQLSPGEKVRPYGCTQPDCAVTWDGGELDMALLSADFKLLENIRWSDGEPLTAADSVFSYNLARSCSTEGRPCGAYGLVTLNWDTPERTASYITLDERSVRWSGVPGYLDPNYRTNFFLPLPEHQLSGVSPAELFTAELTTRLPLGWGAYRMEEWEPGEHIRLSKNPYYFRAGDGLPSFDILEFRFVGQDTQKNLDAINSGECDVLDQEASRILAGEELGTMLEMDSSGQLAAYFTTGTVWEHADFAIQHISYDDGYQPGTDRPAFFNDVRTRQAIAQCMDRQKVVDTVFHGLSSVPVTYLPANHPLFNPRAASYAYDPLAGAALLDAIGWKDLDGDPTTPRLAQGVSNVPDGTPLAFTYATTTAAQRRQASEVLAGSLAGCGIQVDLQYSEAGELFVEGPDGALFGRRFDLAQFAWLTGAQPPCDLFVSDEVPGSPTGAWIPFGTQETETFPLGWGGQNETGYYNPEYDRACQAAWEALPGQPGYLESHLKAQEIFAADLPVIPLYLHLKLVVTRPDLCGLALDPTAYSEMWQIEQFDYGEGCSQ